MKQSCKAHVCDAWREKGRGGQTPSRWEHNERTRRTHLEKQPTSSCLQTAQNTEHTNRQSWDLLTCRDFSSECKGKRKAPSDKHTRTCVWAFLRMLYGNSKKRGCPMSINLTLTDWLDEETAEGERGMLVTWQASTYACINIVCFGPFAPGQRCPLLPSRALWSRKSNQIDRNGIHRTSREIKIVYFYN